MPSHSVKSFIRRGDFFKMVSAMETGASEGMWTYQRYRTWMESRKTWHIPDGQPEEEIPTDLPVVPETRLAPLPSAKTSAPAAPAKISNPTSAPSPSRAKGDLLEIEPEEGGLEAIISKLKDKP